MKLSTVKGKLLIGVIVVGIFSSAGFALANTGAGEALKQWYDNMFGQAVDAAKDEATAYGEEVYDGLLERYEELKVNAAAEIDATRDRETENAQSEIEAAKDEHLASLEEAQAEIEDEMGLKFYQEYMNGWLEIQRLAEEAAAAASSDLAEFTDGEGAGAIAQLTDDLTAAKDAAVTELEDAVETAKAELSDQLDAHSDLLADNLKKEIDFISEELVETVTEITENLVATQQGLIAEVATQLTEEAKNSLDDIVNNINN